MAKSLCITYFLWLIGGWFGLHHLYLRRYKQAFVWICFPGGYFSAGWIRDLWRIPEYVRDANGEAEYLKQLAERMRKYEKPPTKVARTMGELVVANMFGMLCMMAAPDAKDDMGPGINLYYASLCLAPAASALGIWIVGNIGHEKGTIMWPIIGCYLGLPLFAMNYISYSILTIMGIIAFNWKSKQWKRSITRPTPLWKALLAISFCCSIYLLLWGSFFYFNLRVTTKEGDEIKFRDAAGNFIKSPAFQEFTKNIKVLARHMIDHGFWSAWQQLIDSLDPLGEKNALQVLQLERNYTQNDIKNRCRELSKTWHPDKFKGEKEKAEAHEKFVDIQQACEKLSSIKKKRKAINQKSTTEAEHEGSF